MPILNQLTCHEVIAKLFWTVVNAFIVTLNSAGLETDAQSVVEV